MGSLFLKLHAIKEGVLIALDSIRANKVRAGLTILGIAVGVFVVVAISGAIHGINKSVENDFASTGPTSFFVSRYPISFENCGQGDASCAWRRNPPIRPGEVNALRKLESVEQVGEQLGWGSVVKYRDRTLSNSSVEGYSGEWVTLAAPEVFPGRAFTMSEARNASRVAVINTIMAERLFGESDPIGKSITLNG